MAENKAKQVASRVAYVEPNDIYGSVNGVPLAPNYEDYCIGINLIADVVPRYNNNAREAFSDAMKLSWSGRQGENVKVSFLSGRKMGKNNFLSTYYTDISYEDIKEETEVEGLGIDSINIAFESYYVPTVTIKFVDVRGSALFGREAAIHEKGKITAENVFGVFFTMPYPKFKLQVKGFYGKDVTYQLTCTSFQGNFNSSNGNFEATAKFIGYTYSLLTDIPFAYLVSAPFSTYEGRSYWENHINSAEWQLDGKPMITIHELMNKIEGQLIEKNEKNAINEDDSNRLRKIAQETNSLNEIIRAYNQFVNELGKMHEGTSLFQVAHKVDNNPEDVQILVCYNTVVNNENSVYKPMTDDAVKAHENLITLLTSYNTYYTSTAIPESKFPSDNTTNRNTPYTKGYHMVAVDMFNIGINSDNNNEITSLSIKGITGKDTNSVKSFKLNNNLTMNDGMAAVISKLISTEPYTHKARYATLFDMHDFLETVRNRVAKLNDEEKVILKRVNEEKARFVSDVLPIRPTIGNIYKIIFAHLETFMHIMLQGKIDILNSDRTPGTLGVSLDNTDATGIETVPPWPAVYTKNEGGENSGSGDTENYVTGWVGDLSHNFVEEEIVVSMLQAVQRVVEVQNAKKNNNNYVSIFPATPFDINSMNNPFANTTELDLSSLGGYLGIRAAQIFGILFNEVNSNGAVLNNELVSLIGRMDALNYFKAVGSTTAVNMDLFNKIGSQSLSEILKNIATCNTNCDVYAKFYQNTGKHRHTFENNLSIRPKYNNNQRCPIFVTDETSNARYKYVRYYSPYSENMDIGLVPTRLDEFSNYSKTFIYEGNNGNPYFIPTFGEEQTILKPNDYIHRSTTSQFLNGDDEKEFKKYINEDLFNVVGNNDDVSSILVRYEELKKGNIEILEYEGTEDFTPLLNKCWLVDNSKYSGYYNSYGNMFTVSLEEYGYNTSNLLSTDKYSTTQTISNLTDESWVDLDEENNILFNNNGEYVRTKLTASKDGTTGEEKNSLSINDLKIHQLKVYYNKDTKPMSLFGHMFYYIQNNKVGNETDAEFNDRSTKVKALLFLHTLKYNFDYKPNFVKIDKKNGTIEAIPYGYLLFLGGMLWRNRYYQEHNSTDPVVFKENNISFKRPSITQTFFVKENGKYNFSIIDSGRINRNYNVSIQSILGYSDNETNWEFDYVVENKLIRYFEEFVDGVFKNIMLKSELRLIQDDSNTISFNASTFQNFVKTFYNLIYDEKESIDTLLNKLNSTITNLYKNYRYIAFRKNVLSGIILMLNEDSDLQDVIKSIYYGKNIVLDSIGFRLNKNSVPDTNVYVRQNTFNTYIDAFARQLEKIVNGAKTNKPLYDVASDNSNFNKTIATDMYYYFKNLYDRWLIQTESPDYYTVSNFFNKNFIFIDKFYVNIRDIFVINCEKLIKIFKARLTDQDSSLFSVIGDITTEHNCLFAALPDYLGLTGTSLQDDINAMEKAFKPMAYNEMGEPRDENHFVTIYTGPPSSVACQSNNYKSDGFNIDIPDEIPSPFKSKGTSYEDTDVQNRYGYNVPAFGVSFANQNQQIFKNISLNMTNPMDTGISIGVTAQVAELGSSHEHKVMFYGQDTFNIWKNYSYEAEIEMMGDAQIQPLMYFQLLNIPMWHGAYMIKNVTHSITPGNMVTRFKGQKMSRYMPPYCREYFYGFNVLDSVEKENNTTVDITTIPSGNISDITMPDGYNKVSKDGVDTSDLADYICAGNNVNLQLGGVNLNEDTKILFKQLIEEIKQLPENRNGEKWSICLTSAVRNSGNRSEHNYRRGGIAPNAIDIQVCPIEKDGKRKPRIKDAAKLFTVMDLIVTNHYEEIGQLIFEGRRGNNGTDGVTKWFNGMYRSKSDDAYTCLHFSYKGNTVSTGTPAIFLSGNNDGRNFANNRANIELYNSNVPPEYKAIAKKRYAVTQDKNEFRRAFPYYRIFTDSELAEHFGEVRMSNTSDTGYVNANSDNAPKRRNNPGSLEWIGYQQGRIKEGDAQWLGYDISGVSWSPRFCVFKNMTYGIRALFVNMNTQIVRGHNTIASLIGVWAPAHENNTDDYVRTVARAAGVNQETYRLTSIIHNKDVCIAIAKQIAINEGGITLADSEVNKAYNMAASYIQTKNS